MPSRWFTEGTNEIWALSSWKEKKGKGNQRKVYKAKAKRIEVLLFSTAKGLLQLG